MFSQQTINIHQCPNCRSREIYETSKEALQATKSYNNVQVLQSENADTPVSISEELQKLKRFRDTGILTQEEFEDAKKALLSRL